VLLAQVGVGAAGLPVAGLIVEDQRWSGPYREGVAVDRNLAGLRGVGQDESRYVLRPDSITGVCVVAAGVDFSALVMLLKAADRDPVVAVVARGEGDEADVVGRHTAVGGGFGEEGVH